MDNPLESCQAHESCGVGVGVGGRIPSIETRMTSHVLREEGATETFCFKRGPTMNESGMANHWSKRRVGERKRFASLDKDPVEDLDISA